MPLPKEQENVVPARVILDWFQRVWMNFPRCFFRVSPRGSSPGGFTLIELLIVVSIISILAAIAVPNFLEAQTRSKVARIKSDMRTMATAVESYWADNNRYPPRVKFPTGNTQPGIGIVESVNCSAGCRSADLARLTSPIAYISSIPTDVFENGIAPPNNLIDYFDPILVEHLSRGVSANWEFGKAVSPKFGWGLMSVGPDGLFGARTGLGNYPPRLRLSQDSSNTWWDEYDPTNGTISSGNIWRFQRNGATGNEAFHDAWR
jgi:prepilin-type N-terminal cleavage/methylation domain-containing protein